MRYQRAKIPARIVVNPVKVNGILSYDVDNAYPQRTADIVNASGAMTYAISLYSKFIEGNGFKDLVFSAAVVNNKGLTNDKLLRKTAADYAATRGFAIHVNYNGLFKIINARSVPFRDCRLGNPDDAEFAGKIVVYNDWGQRSAKKLKKENLQVFDRFNPDPVVIQEQIAKAGGIAKWPGQVLWFSAAGDDYPLAPYDSVIFDAETDGRIKVHKRKKAATGWNADFMIVTKAPFKGEPEREEFILGLEDYQGQDGEGNIPHLEVEKDEQTPEIIPFPKNDNSKDFYAANEKSVQDNIRKIFGFPGVLVGENQAGALGLSAQMRDAYAVMNGLTYQERRIFEEVFRSIYIHWDKPINPSNDYSIVPVSYVSGEEEKPLAVQFGVGGTQAVQAILADTTLQPMQKVNTLIILFGLSKEQADAMVNGTELKPQDSPTNGV